MTSNQVQNMANKEQARSNRAREGLERSKQKETKRSNKVKEGIGIAKTVLDPITTTASNAAKLFAAANDPSWYNKDPQLVRDAASISYKSAVGIRDISAGVMELSEDGLVASNGALQEPGIMCLKYIPTIGNSTIGTAAAVNIAAKNIYSYVRYANSGARNYEAPDLMLYLVAMDSAYAWYSLLTRAYSVAMTAKGENRYYPTRMLRALGFRTTDSSDGTQHTILNNLSAFRMHINMLATRLSAFYVPHVMPYYDRHIWMNANIFKDSPVKKSQEYVFTPSLLWVYDESNVGKLIPIYIGENGTGGSNQYLQGVVNNISMEFIQQTTNTIINALINSEDIGIMSGDILKAYGENNLFFVRGIPEDFHIESVYSEEVLDQIHSATIYSHCNVDGLTIQQDTAHGDIVMGSEAGYLTFIAPYQNTSMTDQIDMTLDARTLDYLHISSPYLHAYKDDPTPDYNMVSSRLICVPDKVRFSGASGNYTFEFQVSEFGTEIISSVLLIIEGGGVDASHTTPTVNVEAYSIYLWAGLELTDASILTAPTTVLYNTRTWLHTLYISKFEKAPRYCYVNVSAGSTAKHIILTMVSSYLNLENWAILSKSTVSNLHSVAVNSLFGVPLIGTKIKSMT